MRDTLGGRRQEDLKSLILHHTVGNVRKASIAVEMSIVSVSQDSGGIRRRGELNTCQQPCPGTRIVGWMDEWCVIVWPRRCGMDGNKRPAWEVKERLAQKARVEAMERDVTERTFLQMAEYVPALSPARFCRERLHPGGDQSIIAAGASDIVVRAFTDRGF